MDYSLSALALRYPRDEGIPQKWRQINEIACCVALLSRNERLTGPAWRIALELHLLSLLP